MGTTPASRDETDFRHAFDQHYRDILAYAKRRSSVADAEDVAAETFTIAWRKWRLAPEGAVRPWLFGIARRVMANHNRGVRRRERLTNKLTALSPTPAIDVSSDGRAEIDQAMTMLRSADREIIRLHCWEELSPSDIAVVLGCSANAATIRLHRAKQRLAEALSSVPGGWS